ncbi:hypothetical protein [Novipirellula caenicola]|uniref:Secreted protein n=1 Tax=Novipirellula caenicola TaxID=1536901 RepID=A0ABP9W193_9BACT
MRYRLLMFLTLFVPMACTLGCGGSSETRVLEGEVQVDPDVGSDVNDPEKMEALMNADPAPPR